MRQIGHQAMDQEATLNKGKSRANPTTPTFPTDFLMNEPAATPPSRSASARNLRTTSGGQHSQPPAGSNPAANPSIWKGTVFGTPGFRAPPTEETDDSDEEVAPSSNLRRAVTRLQSKVSPGCSSLIGGLDTDGKERTTSKKPRPSLLRTASQDS